jgi:hypothetical protein
MKKKTKKSNKGKQKIDVVLESLLNLETVIKELIKTVEKLQYKPSYELTVTPEKMKPKYWPADYPG